MTARPNIVPSDTLLALAERCGAATDNDIELFEDAFRECFPKPERIWVTDSSGGWTPEYSAYHERSWRHAELLEAGAFLDAAMALVPEGAEVTTQNFGGPGPMVLVEPNERFCAAATLSLALCAAALRARAAQ